MVRGINSKYFTIHPRDITRHARYIYSREQEKGHYLSNLLFRNIYNPERISLSEMPDFGGCGQRTTDFESTSNHIAP